MQNFRFALVAPLAFFSVFAACSTKTEIVQEVADGGARNDDGSTSSGSDSGTSNAGDAGGGGDGATHDAGPTACVPLGGPAPIDAGGGSGPPPTPVDGAACVPLSELGSFAPAYRPPSGLHQGICTAKNIDDFRTYCIGTGDANACQSYLATADGKACAKCILTPPTAGAFGPLIDHTAQGFLSLNTAGCVTLLEPCNEVCARAISDLSQCDDAACINCKVTDDPSLADLNACTTDVEQGVCSTYAQAAACADQLKGADHPAEKCLNADFASGYAFIVPLFCGQ